MDISQSPSDMSPQGPGEIAWDVTLIFSIFAVNGSVLWVVAVSRDLWKPRHLWMACLCITDLFVGVHTFVGLLPLFLEGSRELCVLYKSTIGLPYVINMMLLTLLSLDRFIAVRCPFFYSTHIRNKHVLMGFIIVCIAGSLLVLLAITFGLADKICRAQIIQLVYLTIVLTICSILTLLFNTTVLRIAKKQLSEIYSNESRFVGPRVSILCSNCGYKNDTFMNILSPVTQGENFPSIDNQPMVFNTHDSDYKSIPHIIETNCHDVQSTDTSHHGDESSFVKTYNENDEATAPLVVRTLSLPNIPDSIPLVDSDNDRTQDADTSVLIQIPHLNLLENGNGICKGASTSNLQRSLNLDVPSPILIDNHLPRSKSLGTCRNHKVFIPGKTSRLQLFRSLHFSRNNVFQVRRLFPSIRFARTVLLIMIPMWIFLLPIVTIIPLYRECADGNSTLDCITIEALWRYLLVHMRSVLPLQAIIDTLIYSLGSKEFKQAVRIFIKKQKTKIMN